MARKLAARERKKQRKMARLDQWYYEPGVTTPKAEPVKEWKPTPNPRSWYQFCVERKFMYERVGDKEAAMVYWCLRFIDKEPIGSDQDPCTEAGFESFQGYWDYKSELLTRL